MRPGHERLSDPSLDTTDQLVRERNLYISRWLSCVTQEEAKRLRDEIDRLRLLLSQSDQCPKCGDRLIPAYCTNCGKFHEGART